MVMGRWVDSRGQCYTSLFKSHCSHQRSRSRHGQVAGPSDELVYVWEEYLAQN